MPFKINFKCIDFSDLSRSHDACCSHAWNDYGWIKSTKSLQQQMWGLFKATAGHQWQFMVLKWCEGLNLSSLSSLTLGASQEAGDAPKTGG